MKLTQNPVSFADWTPSQNGPDEREKQELLRQLSALALVETDAAGQLQVYPVVALYLETQGVFKPPEGASSPRRISSAADRLQNNDIERVLEILRAGRVTDSAREVKELTSRLKEARYFGYARQYLALARQSSVLTRDLGRWLPQQQALCTYKDPDLPAESRLDRALTILDKGDPLQSTREQETLGIAGAIHKTRWNSTASGSIRTSPSYYMRGYEQGIEKDQGYTALNAAYVLDLLASTRDQPAAEALSLKTKAQQIREEIVKKYANCSKSRKVRGSVHSGGSW